MVPGHDYSDLKSFPHTNWGSHEANNPYGNVLDSKGRSVKTRSDLNKDFIPETTYGPTSSRAKNAMGLGNRIRQESGVDKARKPKTQRIARNKYITDLVNEFRMDVRTGKTYSPKDLDALTENNFHTERAVIEGVQAGQTISEIKRNL